MRIPFSLMVSKRRSITSRRMIRKLFVASMVLIPGTGWACEPCALYSVTRLEGLAQNSWSLSLSEQYTSYERVDAERNLGRDTEVTESYSTTQLAVGYDFTEQVGLQANIPFIVRGFDRIRDYREDNGTESGLGDISLSLNALPFAHREGDTTALLSIAGGVKLPTGDSGAIDDTLNASTERDALVDSVAHHNIGASTGLGGRILSLGTGSTDYILATGFYGRFRRAMLTANVQYALRTEGDFDYRFNNELIVSGGPGYYLLLDDAYAVALQTTVSAEVKDNDRLDGVEVPGSQVENVYAGLALLLSAQGRYSAEIGFELPTDAERQDSDIVPDYRLRTAFSVRF